MKGVWQWFREKARTGAGPVFVMSVIVYIALTAMDSYDRQREYEPPRATGLGAVGRGPVLLWQQASVGGNLAESISGGSRMQAYSLVQKGARGADERQVVRTGTMSVISSKPQEAVEQIGRLATSVAGYAANVQIGHEDKAETASITLRVPAVRFDETRSQIRRIVQRVEAETASVNDVTSEYVDLQASLKNYRAEEAQYTDIMRRTGAVKDVIAVAEKLAEVRGKIEKTEAQYRLMTHQVAMASLTVALRSEAEAQVLGVQWRPGYELRRAFRDGLQSLANYADAVMAVALKLPAIVLWLTTAFLLIKLGWMWLQWWWRVLRPKPREAM
ncbi:MAG: DUF4349 domain-containing protein [Acidobacteriia bacterium]|nr:DUF4349 domain-containing protein [Terriglobia bacterium]